LPFFELKQRIEAALSAYAGRFVAVSLPNITNVFYGRETSATPWNASFSMTKPEAISASRVRQLSAHPERPPTAVRRGAVRADPAHDWRRYRLLLIE
jgi:hypothetical protein